MSRVPKKKTEGDKFGNFPKKWAKYLDDEEWTSKAQQSSVEELNKMIVECNETISNLEKDYDADNTIQELKNQLKEAEADAGIKLGIKVNMAKSRYCIELKRSLGVKTSDSE